MVTNINQLDLTKQYSYADYLKWKVEERLELISGYIKKMAAPSLYHQKVSRNINHYIDSYFWGKKCNYFCAPFDVRLTRFDEKKDKEVITVVQPDICVICDESKLDTRGCIGSPDLIIEILSPGNSKKEMKDKFEVYEESGVKEYWMVDTSEKTVLVYTLNNEGVFIGHRPFIEDEIMHSFIFPEIEIDLFKVFNS